MDFFLAISELDFVILHLVKFLIDYFEAVGYFCIFEDYCFVDEFEFVEVLFVEVGELGLGL